MQPLLNQFQSFLVGSKHISPSTVKNYVSDINHFLNFVAASIQEPELKPSHITAAVIASYCLSLTQSTSNQTTPNTPTTPTTPSPIPSSSVNRRLSSLRRFGQFLADTKLLDFNPAANVTNLNIDPTLNQVIIHYKKHLETESLSHSTVKNYVSDLKKYLLWAEKNIKTTDNNLNQRKLN